MNYVVHEKGLCESFLVGADTRVGAFTHILPKAAIGSGCIIGEHVFIENDVVIGDRVIIKNGVQLWDGLMIGNDVFIGPNATFANDPFPRSRTTGPHIMPTVIKDNASIGANATILPGVTIGRDAMVGAGAVVTKDVPPSAVVYGNPAIIHSYCSPGLEKSGEALSLPESSEKTPDTIIDLGVSGCLLVPLPSFHDLRGDLVVVEFEKQLPFIPRRHFVVHNVSGSKVRGEHAHHVCKQFLVALHGCLHVVVNNGTRHREVRLDSPGWGLLIEPMVWGIQYKFSADAVLGVYASHPYDNNDYIRDFNEFIRLTGACDHDKSIT